MSIVRKKGQAALTRRQQRRRRSDRGLTPDQRLEVRAVGHARRGTRRTRTHALRDIPIPKQPGADAAFNRTFKGLLVKADATARYEAHGGSPRMSWALKRRRRARQAAAEKA